jgi:hypothetical protein
MAIGTNGIATRSDCNSLCSYSSYKFTTDLYKCVTVEEANGGVSPVCTKTLGYSDTSKCVKYAQLDPRYIKCGVSGPITISVKNGKAGSLDFTNIKPKVIVTSNIHYPKYSPSISAFQGSGTLSLLPDRSWLGTVVSGDNREVVGYFSETWFPNYPTVGATGNSFGTKYGIIIQIQLSGVPTSVSRATLVWADYSASTFSMSRNTTTGIWSYTFTINSTTDAGAKSSISKYLTSLSSTGWKTINITLM